MKLLVLNAEINCALSKGVSKIKINKLDLKLYLKIGYLNWISYLIALLILFVPVSIVSVTEVPFSPFASKLFLSTSLAFIILGKIFTVFKKSKGDKSIWMDVGVIVGFLIVLISKVLK